jgi:hypothetical protein
MRTKEERGMHWLVHVGFSPPRNIWGNLLDFYPNERRGMWLDYGPWPNCNIIEVYSSVETAEIALDTVMREYCSGVRDWKLLRKEQRKRHSGRRRCL